MQNETYQKALESAIEKIISSKSPRKLVVSGPGTGKTTLSQKVLQSLKVNKDECLTLTFINNLKKQLDSDLEGLSQVFTLHGYCHFLLKRSSRLRKNLDRCYFYYPGIVKIIKSDWTLVKETPAPQFVKVFRDLENTPEALEFYFDRANYYNAVGYEDSVYRVFEAFCRDPSLMRSYKLILVDEYQDFNLLEVCFLNKLAQKSSMLVVGDDDQALYQLLRNSSPSYIRKLARDNNYKLFLLPFCLRCTEVILGAFDDIIKKAASNNLLRERLEKDLLFFPPKKRNDSETYPKINEIHTTTQRPDGGNYIGRFILKEIVERVRREDIRESREKNFPTVLVIGPKHYTGQIRKYFDSAGFKYQTRLAGDSLAIKLLDGLKFLKENQNSNLGWRILLEFERRMDAQKILVSSIKSKENLSKILPLEYRNSILTNLDERIGEEIKETKKVAPVIDDETKPSVVLTSFEGAKGLQSCHVFITGLQNGDLPRDTRSISDIEVSKFIVALTRTRKQCYLIYTTNFGGQHKEKSIFIDWIKDSRKRYIKVDKNFWATRDKSLPVKGVSKNTK